MAAAPGCGICSGPTRLLHAGTAGGPRPEDLSPTCHRTGAHGDLYRCRRCGTVRQEGLPPGPALVDLYRLMRDDGYLAEEAGRRATARRLLERVERVTGRGRLLDVGCGHGLLLDEAARRGWQVLGLEPSAAARAHAVGALGLPVRDATPADLDPAERFTAIVLADVIEHFADPVAELRRCAGHLAPGGALLVVTPDPASLTARVARGRWWGYIPAHTHLLPRRTLQRLLESSGLRVVSDRGLRRTFSLRYWAAGLAERGGAAARAAARLDGAPIGRLPVTLSLGDERVVLAVRDERA
ncbi:MAG TPA: class I SAM-dependent methyltransferase [Solirubrobacteraceae bacterium]|nr:class I SAM-dependent methyltransferase [Solirubrobacteraceae bacterium]